MPLDRFCNVVYALIIEDIASGFDARQAVREKIDRVLAGKPLTGPDPETWGNTEEALAEADRFMLI